VSSGSPLSDPGGIFAIEVHQVLSEQDVVVVLVVVKAERNQSLRGIPGGARSQAAQLYRKNWDGCRDLWKLNCHGSPLNFTVL
jgi:hypothetical protein